MSSIQYSQSYIHIWKQYRDLTKEHECNDLCRCKSNAFKKKLILYKIVLKLINEVLKHLFVTVMKWAHDVLQYLSASFFFPRPFSFSERSCNVACPWSIQAESIFNALSVTPGNWTLSLWITSSSTFGTFSVSPRGFQKAAISRDNCTNRSCDSSSQFPLSPWSIFTFLWGGPTIFQQNRQDFHEPVKISKAFKTKLQYITLSKKKRKQKNLVQPI